MTGRWVKIILLTVFSAAVVAAGYFGSSFPKLNRQLTQEKEKQTGQVEEIQETASFQVSGVMSCLENKDGSTIDGCVYGLKGDDGNNYALLFIKGGAKSFSEGKSVEVIGDKDDSVITPYKISSVITVTSVIE